MWRITPRNPLTSILIFYCLLLQLMCVCPEYTAPRMDQLDLGQFFSHRSREQGLRRVGRLYSQCSGRHVALGSSQPIKAMAGPADPLGDIQFRSVTTKQGARGVVISGVLSKMYLCFDKRGRQILRNKGRDKKCMFAEEISPAYYSKYRSLYNDTWYLAFSKRGDRLSGADYLQQKHQHCERFSKRNLTMTGGPSQLPGPQLPPSLLESLLPPHTSTPRTRHRRRRRRKKHHRRPQR